MIRLPFFFGSGVGFLTGALVGVATGDGDGEGDGVSVGVGLASVAAAGGVVLRKLKAIKPAATNRIAATDMIAIHFRLSLLRPSGKFTLANF